MRFGPGLSCLSINMALGISRENGEIADCRWIQSMCCLIEEHPIKSFGSGQILALLIFTKILTNKMVSETKY